MPLCKLTTIDSETTSIDFDAMDKQGRAMGYEVVTKLVMATRVEDATSGYRLEPGIYWSADTRATRDGELYGPITSGILERTSKAMEAKLAKRVENARKRARATADLYRRLREEATADLYKHLREEA